MQNDKTMKRVPMVFAVLTAIALTACVVEYGFRGLNPPVESDWVLHPSWWQSDHLADIGLYLVFLAGAFASQVEHHFPTHPTLVACTMLTALTLMVIMSGLAALFLAKVGLFTVQRFRRSQT